MEACNFKIGKPVVVTLNSTSNVKIAWPSKEGSITTAFLTKEGLESFGGKFDSQIIVSPLRAYPIPLKQITLKSYNFTEDTCNLENMLSATFRDKIVNLDTKLICFHFGRKLKFNITSVTPFESPSLLSENLDSVVSSLVDLGIDSKENESRNSQKYYKILSNSNFVITKDKSKEKTEQYFVLPSLSQVGGLQSVIEEIQDIIDLAFGSSFGISRLKVAQGILLFGPSGTGKTLLANAICTENQLYTVKVNAFELYSKYLGESESRIQNLFKDAEENTPSVILLDELDSLCPKRDKSNNLQETRIISTVVTLLDRLKGKKVFVIGITSSPENLDPALRRPGRLDREIEIAVPIPEARFDILRKLLFDIPNELSNNELYKITLSAHGFVGADLRSVITYAGTHAVSRNKGSDNVVVTVEDFVWALSKVKPSAMREILIQVPNVRWEDIGGQEELKLKLCQAVEWPLKHPEVFENLGITPPRGILMFGPPGCSKTMIAKALATESKLNFISIKGPELFSKWVGASEKAVREVFRKARQVAPSVIFFDEIDALGSERSSSGDGGSSVQERVVAQLLTELDGIEPLGNVTILAATNRPDRIDKALLRPGRLGRMVYVPLPDMKTRFEILSIQFKKTKIASDVDVHNLVIRTEGFSGAEVLAVCHEAALKAAEEDLAASEVKMCHFSDAFQVIKPRTPKYLLDLYETYVKR